MNALAVLTVVWGVVLLLGVIFMGMGIPELVNVTVLFALVMLVVFLLTRPRRA